MGVKIIAYSYQGNVNAVEINEEDIGSFVAENEMELDKDTDGQPAYSIYSMKVNTVETAKTNFANSYMTIHEELED